MIFEIFISISIFFISYIISVTFTSIFYHRALCHGALTLSPTLRKFVLRFGFLITAIDPAIWICTHRLHHIHSDTQEDPHTPRYFPTLLKMNTAHFTYYKKLNAEFRRQDSHYFKYINDLNITLHPLMFLPDIPFVNISWGNFIAYFLHFVLYLFIFQITGSLLYPLALACGLLGHPVQGILVNYFGHIGTRFSGYRNFDLNDDSCNNKFVALCIFGEGYQNNHHHNAKAINFAMKPGEFDFGFQISKVLRALKFVHF